MGFFLGFVVLIALLSARIIDEIREAAANYVRQAFEVGIRGASEAKSIKLPYKQDATGHKAQALLTGLSGWSGNDKVPKIDWDNALARLEMMKNVVMNPYSHPSALNIPRQEIVEAADAVEKFLELARRVGSQVIKRLGHDLRTAFPAMIRLMRPKPM